MSDKKKRPHMDRRDFLKVSAATAALAGTVSTTSFADGDELDHRNERPDRMAYRQLGRTQFMSSRLVFGGGSALAGGKAVRLLEHAYEAGINLYDLGSDVYYKGSEGFFADFRKAHRDDIFVVSKAPIRAGRPPKFGEEPTVEYAKEAAKKWAALLDQSLADMKTDFIDAYYIMMVAHPGIVKCEEIYQAFLDAKEAGKVRYFGISTHQKAKECLEAAVETGWYDLAMVGVSPAGWYNGIARNIERDTPSLKELRPIFDRAREAGIGLVGMKAVQHIAATPRGPKDTTVFDSFYDEKVMASPLNPFQRAMGYVLENGMDVVNVDMQTFKFLEENLIAARSSAEHFA